MTWMTLLRSLWETAKRWVNPKSLMDWDSARHPGSVTEREVATFDDVNRDWKEDQSGLQLRHCGRDPAI